MNFKKVSYSYLCAAIITGSSIMPCFTPSVSATAVPAPVLTQAENNVTNTIINNVANSEDQVITVVGHGFASDDAIALGNINYCKLTAVDAAKEEAYAAMAERIDGIQVDAKSTVTNHRTTSRVVETKVSGFIRGADVISEEYSDDGTACVVTMQLKITNKTNPDNSLTAAIMPDNTTPEKFIQPSKTAENNIMSTAAAPAMSTYTGVIIDCSGLGLKTAMSPVIKDSNGRSLYGYKNLNSKYICKYGMAGYTTAEANNISRAGSNPLIIKATTVENSANPVIPAEQGELMLIANQKTHFLDNCAVVFIK